PDSQPYKNIHLLSPTIPLQTIPFIQHFLTNPNQEQIHYQRQYPPTLSHFFKPPQHNILSTITTLPTPHNRTPPPHKLRSTKFIKHTINTIPKIRRTKPLHLQLPFSQSPFKHQPNQSYPQYPKPIPNTKLSHTQHHPLNHLT
ncbi:lipase-like domain-containing protein, partial [Staphylococcus epidermidis]